MLADAEAAGELELVSSLRTILFGEPDPHPMPTGEHFSDLFEPEDVPHLGNQEADGPYGGKRYLKLMDIAEVWASPIPTSFVDDLDPIEATATRFLARQSDVRTAVRVDEERDNDRIFTIIDHRGGSGCRAGRETTDCSAAYYWTTLNWFSSNKWTAESDWTAL